MSTRLPVGATFSMDKRNALAAGERPMSSYSWPARTRKTSFSRRNPSRLDGTADDQQQTVGFERFFDKIVGAPLDGGDRRLDVAVAAYHDDRCTGMPRRDLVKQL